MRGAPQRSGGDPRPKPGRRHRRDPGDVFLSDTVPSLHSVHHSLERRRNDRFAEKGDSFVRCTFYTGMLALSTQAYSLARRTFEHRTNSMACLLLVARMAFSLKRSLPTPVS